MEDDAAPLDPAGVDQVHALAERAARMDDDRTGQRLGEGKLGRKRRLLAREGGLGRLRFIRQVEPVEAAFAQGDRSAGPAPVPEGREPADRLLPVVRQRAGMDPDRVTDASRGSPAPGPGSIPSRPDRSRWRSSSRPAPRRRGAAGPGSSPRRAGESRWVWVSTRIMEGTAQSRGSDRAVQDPVEFGGGLFQRGRHGRHPLRLGSLRLARAHGDSARGRLADPPARALGHPRAERLRQDIAPAVDHRLPVSLVGRHHPPRPDVRPSRLARPAAEDRDRHQRHPGLDSAGRDRAGHGGERPVRPARPLGPPRPGGNRPGPSAPAVRRGLPPGAPGMDLPLPGRAAAHPHRPPLMAAPEDPDPRRALRRA